MNRGRLACCNSVIAGTSINHPALLGRAGSTKYVNQAAQETEERGQKKKNHKREAAE